MPNPIFKSMSFAHRSDYIIITLTTLYQGYYIFYFEVVIIKKIDLLSHKKSDSTCK